MNELEVLIPIAPSRQRIGSLAPRLSAVAGRIGLLDNLKANAGELLTQVAQGLRAPDHAFELKTFTKNATAAAPDVVMAHLKQCDAVILAIADWGSCTSWSVHDAIALEACGIPTAVICSDEFGPLARAEAEVLGLPSLPLIPIPHPLAGNSHALVTAKAHAIVTRVADALTADPQHLSARYAEQFQRLTERRLQHGAVCVDEVCAVDPALITRP